MKCKQLSLNDIINTITSLGWGGFVETNYIVEDCDADESNIAQLIQDLRDTEDYVKLRPYIIEELVTIMKKVLADGRDDALNLNKTFDEGVKPWERLTAAYNVLETQTGGKLPGTSDLATTSFAFFVNKYGMHDRVVSILTNESRLAEHLAALTTRKNNAPRIKRAVDLTLEVESMNYLEAVQDYRLGQSVADGEVGHNGSTKDLSQNVAPASLRERVKSESIEQHLSGIEPLSDSLKEIGDRLLTVAVEKFDTRRLTTILADLKSEISGYVYDMEQAYTLMVLIAEDYDAINPIFEN